MDNLDDILSLLQKKIDGCITLEESALLSSILIKNPHLQEVIDKIENESLLWEDVTSRKELDRSDDIPWDNKLKDLVFQKLEDESEQQQKIRRTRFLWLKAAGVIALLISMSYLYIVFIKGNVPYKIEIVNEITVPSDAIILRSDNGPIIQLESSKSALHVGHDITYDDGEVLRYNLASNEMLNLEVPRGRSFQITLSDGTIVWLNSGSKLRYPKLFSDEKREVELEGEGYFEVSAKTNRASKERVPFLIKTPKQTVQVIGTSFNIQAYPDDNQEKTTLLHGKVRVSFNESKKNGVELNVGEQSLVDANEIKKRSVDLDEVMAWRENIFFFNNTDFDQALKTLSRWYDFDVIYEAEVPKSQFFAEIKRSNKLSTVLKILEKGGVKFRMEKYGDRFRLVVNK